MPRPFHFHVYDRPLFDGLPPFASASVSVPGPAKGSVESRDMYSLKRDMDQLRADGSAKGIVDASVISIGQSAQGRDLWALKVGKNPAHKVLFTGCHHAREWISVEIPYLVAEYLIQKYTDTPSTPQEKRIKHLLLNREILFVPLANPDGHDYNMTIDRTWRPNRKSYTVPGRTIKRSAAHGGDVTFKTGTFTGVDINRNYGTSDWSKETFHDAQAMTSQDPRDGGADSIWCGLKPSGEAESALIDALIQKNQYRSSISYHNFSEELLFPDAAASDAYLQWTGKGMRDLIAAAGHPYTFLPGAGLYPTSGDLLEFTYEKVPGRPTFLPEVRPGGSEDAWPKGTGFSGLPDSEIEPTFKENLPAALALINCAGQDKPAAPVTLKAATGATAAKCQVVLNAWEVFEGWVP